MKLKNTKIYYVASFVADDGTTKYAIDGWDRTIESTEDIWQARRFDSARGIIYWMGL